MVSKRPTPTVWHHQPVLARMPDREPPCHQLTRRPDGAGPNGVAMDLKDATLMFLAEAAAYPAVTYIARSAYDRLVEGQDADYRELNDLVWEASGKGVLRAMHQKYSPVVFEAIIMPV